jgi:hypothetical protein
LSSILRALKKLDEDSLSQDRETSKQKIKMRQMVNRRARTPWVINRLLPILLALLVLGTAGWIITNSIQTHSPTKKQPQDSVYPRISPSPDTSPKRFPLTSLPKEDLPLKKDSSKESLPPATGEQSKPLTDPSFSKSEWHTQPKRVSEVVKPVGIEKVNVEKIERPEFILNAILWSHIPVKRIALINNRYLKEGDIINGVSVIQIGKKTVTLKSGEEKWTIRLQKK